MFQDLFKDFQMLNSINLTDKDKEQIAGHYKKQEPHFLQENEKLQVSLKEILCTKYFFVLVCSELSNCPKTQSA